MAGKVFLVGAGPGDPGLITVKGLRCLGQAEVVVYDRLMDSSLLESAADSAERVFVERFTDQVNDDLNTPRALAVVWDLVKSKLDGADKKASLRALPSTDSTCARVQR